MLPSAKEAFYKAQFPSTREQLEFDAVAIEWGSVDTTAGGFSVKPTQDLVLRNTAAWPVRGRFEFHEGYVSVGVALMACG